MPRDSEEYIIPSVAGCHMLHATIDPVSSLEQRVLASWDSTNAAQSEPLRGRSSPVFAASSPHVETATADTITLSGSQLVKCIIHYNNKPYPGKILEINETDVTSHRDLCYITFSSKMDIRCWCGYLSAARCRLFAYGPLHPNPPIISCLI